MADVARLAGVSLQTVSRVVNDSPNVSGATRARVLAAMDHLDYRRNAVARALATRRSGVVGVLTIDTVLYGPIRMLYAVEQSLSRRGMGVSVAVVDRVTTGSVTRALHRLHDQGVEGVIALTPHDEAVPVLGAGPGSIPTVLVGAVPTGAGETPAVELDQQGAAAAATRHLLELGHRTVHHVAGPQAWLSARRRVEGWQAALTAAGAPIPELRQGDWTAGSGHAAMSALLVAHPGLTAVFAGNDSMALGALSALAASGRRVPEDVSVVGFDDTPEARFFRPSLTTVRQRFDDAGERAVRLLMSRIRPEEGSSDRSTAEVLPAELMVRASTAPPCA